MPRKRKQKISPAALSSLLTTKMATVAARKREKMPHAKYGVDLSQVPDYVEPFVAYRAWHWNESGITSLNHAAWTPKVAFEAVCSRNEGVAQAVGVFASHELTPEHPESLLIHPVPSADCSCGMYAGINFQHLIDIGYAEHGIHGEVSLWGRLERCTLGWRAQYAYPKNFIVPHSMLPYDMASFKARMESLIAFDVDIYIQTENVARVGGEKFPLWVKDYGYSSVGLAWITDQRAKWYSDKPNVKGLAVGDRLAVLHDKGGIAIVQDVTAENVYFKLFGQTVYRIPLKATKWNMHNWRWETSMLGSVTQYPRSNSFASTV